LLSCSGTFVASGPLSLIGAGADRTILRFDHPCELTGAVMSWISKSGIRVSGFTLDLNGSSSQTRQDILEFQAYRGDARGLRVDHLAIVNGHTLSLQIAVAAAGGFSYSGVVIDGNRLQMTPGRTQNQCIALSTVDGAGMIPAARITANICRGSGIQADGEGTLVAGNDISGYEFGTGIFTAFTTHSRSQPNSRNCIIRDNVMHDTQQSLDVNRTPPGGLENNCVNSRVENNQAINLGGAGFFNFANGARYIGNRASGVGHVGGESAGGDADAAAFVAFDNGSALAWYHSLGVVFERNISTTRGGRPRFGYFEEPFHQFSAILDGNDFHGSERSSVIRDTRL
jgi:hypothetical protein